MLKKLFFIFLLGMLGACGEQAKQQETTSAPEKDTLKTAVHKEQRSVEEKLSHLKASGYDVFSYKEADTTYVMQKYFMVFLKSGENRSQDSVTLSRLQQGHLAHLGRMASLGKACLIGPMADDTDLRGIVVYNTQTQEEVDSLSRLDPMVKAGRLSVEIHPWWAAKGSVLK